MFNQLKLMGLVPKIISAITSKDKSKVMAIIPDVLDMFDDSHVDLVKAALLKYVQEKNGALGENCHYKVLIQPTLDNADVTIGAFAFNGNTGQTTPVNAWHLSQINKEFIRSLFAQAEAMPNDVAALPAGDQPTLTSNTEGHA